MFLCSRDENTKETALENKNAWNMRTSSDEEWKMLKRRNLLWRNNVCGTHGGCEGC